MSKHWFAVLAVAVLALGAPAVVAQTVEGKSLDDPKTEAMAFDIAQRTMSPFCPGRTLADCPSGNATEWRQDIRAMLQKGMSPAEIQKVLNQRAGENLSGAPESSLGWVLPVALVLGALVVLSLVLRRIRRDDADDAAAEPGVSRTREDDEDAEDDEEAEDDDEAKVPAAHQRSEKQERELEERLRRELADDEA
ncbi:MAG TPA: cytochrome c-type biogenesis protein CcmH [Polyangiaceae bacterium]